MEQFLDLLMKQCLANAETLFSWLTSQETFKV